jgi:type II secretory pathway pseudopilin PulG
MQPRLQSGGFTLVELAMALFVMALLLGSVMYTLSAQTDQRMHADTLRSLDEAKELLLTFAIVNGRMPCPASTTSNGAEADSPAGSRNCTNYYNGFLPARAIGFQPQDASGYGLDAWGNRLRYAVPQVAPVNSQTPRVCRPISPTTAPATPHFTHKDNLKTNGIDCAPNDLVICTSANGITTSPPSCGPGGAGQAGPVTNQNVVSAVIWSQGKNFASSSYLGVVGQSGDDERVNNKTSANSNHAVFVAHPPAPSGAPGGQYDDLLVWIPVGQLYGRLVASGVLP